MFLIFFSSVHWPLRSTSSDPLRSKKNDTLQKICQNCKNKPKNPIHSTAEFTISSLSPDCTPEDSSCVAVSRTKPEESLTRDETCCFEWSAAQKLHHLQLSLSWDSHSSEDGYWLQISDYWLIINDYWLMSVDYWLLVADCWLLIAD